MIFFFSLFSQKRKSALDEIIKVQVPVYTCTVSFIVKICCWVRQYYLFSKYYRKKLQKRPRSLVKKIG